MKRVMNILLALVFLLTLTGVAFAADASLIWVEDGVWYEKNTQMFVYSADDNELLRTSVVDGMITTKMVSVTADVPAKLRIYRNGELFGRADLDIGRTLVKRNAHYTLARVTDLGVVVARKTNHHRRNLGARKGRFR